ncbi:UDP-xylose transporter 3 [Populus alba x Populus x berolinensis]|nr:UDP-xylose transporter 3 [Populus alba x Populus x berolinensis]
MSEGQKFQLGTVGALSLSVVSSVSIVICNKALISTLGFTFATTLTSWHLLVTFCSLHMALWMKLFEHKPFDARAVMGFGILNGISIGLLNLSLGFNSVGFYQMTKLAIIPCTVLLETLFFRKQFSRSIQLSLTILLMGVGIATVTDLQLNVLGSILSLLAVLTTCVAQIMTNTIQKKFRVSSTQLLYQSCPYQALTLFIVGPFLDGLLTNKNVFAFKYTPLVLFFIVLSCLISVSVNFSTFLVIGKTSPVTYQVLGHLKTCLVLAFGYGLLRDPFSWRNILGILIAVVGMVLYSYCCTLENQQKQNEAPAKLPEVKESETDPLISAENGAGILADGGVPKIKIWKQNCLSNEDVAGKGVSHSWSCADCKFFTICSLVVFLFIGEEEQIHILSSQVARMLQETKNGQCMHAMVNGSSHFLANVALLDSFISSFGEH